MVHITLESTYIWKMMTAFIYMHTEDAMNLKHYSAWHWIIFVNCLAILSWLWLALKCSSLKACESKQVWFIRGIVLFNVSSILRSTGCTLLLLPLFPCRGTSLQETTDKPRTLLLFFTKNTTQVPGWSKWVSWGIVLHC